MRPIYTYTVYECVVNTRTIELYIHVVTAVGESWEEFGAAYTRNSALSNLH